VKNATANSWDSHLYVDGVAVGGAQTLDYTSTGALAAPAGGSVSYGTYTPTTGANPITLTFDLSRSTQFGDTFSVTNVTQDGYTTGRLVGISIDSTGIVQARYQRPLARSARSRSPVSPTRRGCSPWAITGPRPSRRGRR
jgi:flagellar hook protein FlgE